MKRTPDVIGLGSQIPCVLLWKDNLVLIPWKVKGGYLGLKGTECSDVRLFPLWGFSPFSPRVLSPSRWSLHICHSCRCQKEAWALLGLERLFPWIERIALQLCKDHFHSCFSCSLRVLMCLVRCVSFRSNDHCSEYRIERVMVLGRFWRFIYSSKNEVLSSFLLNAKEEITYRRTLMGIPREEGDDPLELSSFSLVAITSVSSAEGKEAV